MSQSLQQLRDEIGTPADAGSVFKVKKEKLVLKELATRVSTRTIGDSFILGHSTNGTLGSSNSNVLGDDRGAITVIRVVNPNNTFQEYFRTDTFKGASTTADWDTTNHWLEIAHNETCILSSIYKNNDTIYTITITMESDDDVTDLLIFLSANGGSNYEAVIHNTKHTFSNTGTDLRILLGNTSGSTITITKVKVTYN